jgi:hypothetical protein
VRARGVHNTLQHRQDSTGSPAPAKIATPGRPRPRPKFEILPGVRPGIFVSKSALILIKNRKISKKFACGGLFNKVSSTLNP